ncbi:MAG: gluconate permease [Blastopirellula sp.]|nr:MAG: gluconate permease [Blastopirellula sp.]
MSQDDIYYALTCLGVGMFTVLGLIIFLRANAFLALITAAMVVSLMAEGSVASKFSRVAEEFGKSAGGIGIVIALAAIIGKCMLDSGAADRVVRAAMKLVGEKRAPVALMGSGFVLAVPVFFDTVFYLLVPLARSLFKKTNRNYLLYIMAIGTGGAITHTLVPPTPGPLIVADQLNVDKGLMIMIGALVALPAAIAGLAFSSYMNRIMPLPMRQVGTEPEPEPLDDDKLPPLWLALAPVLLPVVMISCNTVLTTIADAEAAARLSVADIKDWDAFRTTVQAGNAAVDANISKRIISVINKEGAVDSDKRAPIAALLMKEESLTEEEKATVVAGLNNYVLRDRGFPADRDSLFGIKMSDSLIKDVQKNKSRMKPVDAERMNRRILESAYGPEVIAAHKWDTPARNAANWASLLGNASFALLLSAVISMVTLLRQRCLSLKELGVSVETALMSGGLIILITAGGGAFGAMLQQAEVGEAIRTIFQGNNPAGAQTVMTLTLGFGIAAMLKIAQGSSTVAMITGSAMLVGVASPEVLGCNAVYLATSIGAGSLIGSWMNDSGFWVFAKMSGITEVEALKTWTPLLLVLGIVSFLVSLGLALVMPLTNW